MFLISVQRKTWTGPEIAYLRHVCFEHEDLRSLIAQRKWRRAAERLAPLLRDEFYAEPFAAESPADFVARYTSQHRSGHARKSLKRRTRRETQAEYAARLTRLPAVSLAVYLRHTAILTLG